MTTKTPYTIDTDRPTEGPWRTDAFGNRYASVTFADGRKFFVSVTKGSRRRIAFKPRGENWGWRWYGAVNDANGVRLASEIVTGSIGVRGLLKLAGLL
jgi:hypothetical protein